MLVIGVVGEKGAGKDTFSSILLRHLEGKKVVKLRFSDILLETLQMWGIEGTRHNLQRMAIVMDEEFGRGTLTEATRLRIVRLEAEVALLEGIRWKSDVPMLRSFERNLLVYVTAEPMIRWERTRKRGEKVGESEASYAQFLREEKADTERDIASIGAEADVTIVNNGTQAQFELEAEHLMHTYFSDLSK